MVKFLVGAATALSLIAVPVVAAAAPVNPAASLSLSNGARAGAPAKNTSKVGGAAVYALLIAAGVAAILVIAATQDDNSNNNPSSP